MSNSTSIQSNASGVLTLSGDGGVVLQGSGTSAMVVNSTGTNATIQAGSTLDTTSTGMINLPTQFKINSSAVSTNVTATNLNTLTAGSSSNADTLHTHSTLSGFAKTLFTIDTTGTNVTNTTTETSLITGVVGSQTIAANTLVAGNIIRISAKLFAAVTNGYGGSLTLRIKLGSSVFYQVSSIFLNAFDSIQYLSLDFDIVCRSTGSSGSFFGSGQVVSTGSIPTRNGAQQYWWDRESPSVDTTSSQTVDITAQWTSASTNAAINIDILSAQIV